MALHTIYVHIRDTSVNLQKKEQRVLSSTLIRCFCKKSSSIGLYSLSRKKVCTLASSCSLTLAQLSYLLNYKVFSSWCTVRQLSELTNVSALFFWIDCTCICKRYLVSHKHRQNWARSLFSGIRMVSHIPSDNWRSEFSK